MAAKKYFVDLNLNKNQITELSLENRIEDPNAPVSGEIYFNSIDKKIKFYDGSSWQSIGQISADYVVYKGTLTHSASLPSSPKTGDLYIFSSSGTAVNFNNQKAESGDFVIYNGSTWDIIQKNLNLETATDSVSGLIQLATQNEVNDGTDNAKAITASTLDGYRLNKTLISVLLFENQTVTVAGVTLTHNLGNKNLNLEFYQDNEKIILGYTTPTINTVVVKSTFELQNINIIVMGCSI